MAHAHSAHSLAHYEEVSLYEAAFKKRKHDVEFFLRRAAELEPGSSILEWGAGTGRVTFPLARAGHRVCAVDASRPMLARLEERRKKANPAIAERIDSRRGDMRTLRVSDQFPLILATFNVVAHLQTFRDMGAFLKNVSRHLAPDGRFIFDVPIPHPDEIEADPEQLHRAPRFKHPDSGQWVRQTERFEYDAARQVLLVESEFRVESMPDPLVVPLVLRQWFPKEVEALLIYEGFEHIETYADYEDRPGIMAVDTLIFSARRS